MLRWLRRLLAMSTCTLILLGAFVGGADASGVPRVSGLDVVGPNWCASALKVRWHGVSGASYQLRWASSKAGLASARPVTVAGTRASAGPLSMTGKSYIQVRAVRAGSAGAWSRVVVGRFGSHWPNEPKLSGVGLSSAVRFTWGCVKYAARYRVRWSAAPWGEWPGPATYTSPWLAGSARSSTFRVPTKAQLGDRMLGVAYANPVWGRLEAANTNGGVRQSTGWKPVFPAPRNPGTGDPLRVGTYNVKLFPTTAPRTTAIAMNIGSHKLTVVTLQEARATTAEAVIAQLGAGWSYVAPNNRAEQQILYRTDRYRVSGNGTISVPNPNDPTHPQATPWARLTPLVSADPGHGQSFYVSSIHVTTNQSASLLTQKRQAGSEATTLMNGIDNVAGTSGTPVVVAGELRYLREPYGDLAGYTEAQPTFVRRGYYDAMAALRKTNIAFTTFNGGTGMTSARQTVAKSGIGARSDYVMLRGFRGSNAYVNVANWSYGGVVPSDHNLVYADVTVPFAP